MAISRGRPRAEDRARAAEEWRELAESEAADWTPPPHRRDSRRRHLKSHGYRGSWPVTLGPDVYAEMTTEAVRLGLSISGVAQLAWKLARETLQAYPAALDPRKVRPPRAPHSYRDRDRAERAPLMRAVDADEAALAEVLAVLPPRPAAPSLAAELERARRRDKAAAGTRRDQVVRALMLAGRPLDLDELQRETGIRGRRLCDALTKARRARQAVRVDRGVYALAGAVPPGPPPKRYRLLAVLAHGEAGVAALARAVGWKRQAVKDEMKALIPAGLVERRGEARYALTPAGHQRLDEILDGVLEGRVLVRRTGDDDDEREGTTPG